MAKLSFTPSIAIKGKYEIVNTEFPIFHSKIGVIDFRTISIDDAEKLVQRKCRYIKRKGTKTPL